MNKPTATTLSLVLAGLLSAGAVSAQTAASSTSPLPVAAGEASTTVHGRPNAMQEPVGTAVSRDAVRAEAKGQVRQDANLNSPKGEASTTGPYAQPNMAPAGSSPESMTRAQRRAEKDMKKTLNGAAPVDYHAAAKRAEPFEQRAGEGTPK